MKYLHILLISLLPVTLAAQPQHPKNIILLIGDGMGLTQVTAPLYVEGRPLNLLSLPVTGLIKTHAAKDLITDSAAAATAMACGCKTINGYVGVNEEKKPCTTLLELAEANQFATGLVANASITHATPAAFIAHVHDRAQMEDIAGFIANSSCDLLIGAGMKYFSERTDGRNLYREMAEKGWVLENYKEIPFDSIRPDVAKPFAWFSEWEEPASIKQGRNYLAQAAAFAPTFLDKRSEKGFFVMIEGSQIDWACHKNDGELAVLETREFDNAVGAALEFARKDNNTLVIVTADHETGGLALVQGNSKMDVDLQFNSDNHTATLVPVFAYGPGAEAFGGVFDNTQLYQKMREALQLQDVQPVNDKGED